MCKKQHNTTNAFQYRYMKDKRWDNMGNCCDEIINEIEKVIKGKNEVIHKILAAILAGGNVLLEDTPGVGKTTLSLAFSKVMSLSYKRTQFTSDVLPSDIVGFSMYNQKTKEFEYQEGPIMSNLFLADEINRTSAKTQSALLEAMEEKKVTVDGVTRKLPEPFVVIATQNPLGSAGTQPLPESQLDRFMICLSIGYPNRENAIEILKGHFEMTVNDIQAMLTLEELREMQKKAGEVFVHDNIFAYIVDLTEETRRQGNFQLGISPRGSIALLKMSKAIAYMNHRDYVIADDVNYIFYDTFAHRVLLSAKAKSRGISKSEALKEILDTVKVARE